jgi:hypothetical protein
MARVDLEKAQARLSRVEQEFAEVSAYVERRLAAIQLVEDMAAENDPAAERHPYRDLSQEQAMRAALAKAGEAMNSTALAEVLKRGGYAFRSTNPANAVVVAANANRSGYFRTFKEGNRTLIALKEWEGEVAPNPFDELNDPDDSSDIGPGGLGFGRGGM